ncbi:MAG: hypothetical protein QM607_02310 [Microbacterium sp.]
MAKRYYKDHRDYGGEVDHAQLLGVLGGFDGWALSTSAKALPEVLALCPSGVRVAAWVRGPRPTRARGALSAWEPVIYRPARSPVRGPSAAERVEDVLVHGVRARTTDPARVVGAKPAVFAGWMFALIGAAPGDDFTDLFPGSGGVGRAWRVWSGGGVAAGQG